MFSPVSSLTQVDGPVDGLPGDEILIEEICKKNILWFIFTGVRFYTIKNVFLLSKKSFEI